MLSRAMSNYAPSTDDPFLPSNFTEPRASDLSFSSHVRSSAVDDSNALYTNAGSRKDPTMTDYQTASFGGGNQDQRNFSSNATNAYGGLYQQQPQPHTQLYDGKASALRRGYNDVGGYSQPASNQRYDASQYAPWQPISQHQQHPRPGQGYGTTTPDALSNYMRSMNVIDEVDTGKPASAMAAYDQQSMHQPVNSAVATNAAGGEERYSRKVFVGGLPPDIDEDEIHSSFLHFGEHSVDWPHKIESKSCFPPKGYCFLIFNFEESVHGLIQSCKIHGDKYLIDVSSPTMKNKEVQIRPWRLADADFVLGAQLPLDPRKTVFVGGVPRPLKAIEIAMILDRLYGGVCYAGIDTDPELKYPKGAGRVSFSNQQSYISAISARFVHLQHADIDKKVEVKPYVLDDQPCDECNGARCMGKVAPYFCQNVTCLQYYCEHCWNLIHSKAGREFHKPLIKEGSDRPKLQSGVQQHTQQQAAQVTGGASGVSADPSSVGYY